MKTSITNAFTLIELLVVISIIAILAGIALPVFGAVQVKGAQTKALSNAKQIATALKLYAVDNGGAFPSYVLSGGKPTAAAVTTSNDAFAQIIPDYIPSEDIFWLAKSKWCTGNGPDNKIDPSGTDVPTDTLKAGENEWTYVLALSDTSNSSYPLIADGFEAAAAQGHTYTFDETLKGGVWKGKNAVVVHVDTSGVVQKVDHGTRQILGSIGTGTDTDIFSVSSPNTWLGAANLTVPPK